LAACRAGVSHVAISSHTDSIYITKLIPYPNPADSAMVIALMECSEEGKVVLKSLETSHTKNVELQVAIDSLGELLANMTVKRDTIYVPQQEVYVDRRVEVPVEVEAKLTRWQTLKQDIGGWAIGALSAVVLALIGWLLWRMKR
jgi:hypothetical protein